MIWQTFDCPPGVRTYGELASGELCSDGREIKSEKECRKAAKTLEMEFGQAWTGNNGFPGCLIANDGRNKVYFNLSPTPSTTANNPAYGAICITTAGDRSSKHLKGRSVPRVSGWRFLDHKGLCRFPVSRHFPYSVTLIWAPCEWRFWITKGFCRFPVSRYFFNSKVSRNRKRTKSLEKIIVS